MLGFDYNKFKEALRAADAKRYEELKNDIAKTKIFLEKMLKLIFESSASMARANYPGIDP